MGELDEPVRAIVFTGGDPAAVNEATLLPGALVVAADSGLDVAVALGIDVDVAVGDFDSASPAAIRVAAASGTRVDRHPEAKDHSDLDLALRAARDLGARRVTVLGGGGGRLDHLFANLAVLVSPEHADLEIDAFIGPAHVVAVRERRVCLTGAVGELVSLFAVGARAEGVTTSGLRYPLRDEVLEPGSTRGLSNVHIEEHASVTVGRGALLAIHPGAPGPPSKEPR